MHPDIIGGVVDALPRIEDLPENIHEKISNIFSSVPSFYSFYETVSSAPSPTSAIVSTLHDVKIDQESAPSRREYCRRYMYSNRHSYVVKRLSAFLSSLDSFFAHSSPDFLKAFIQHTLYHTIPPSLFLNQTCILNEQLNSTSPNIRITSLKWAQNTHEVMIKFFLLTNESNAHENLHAQILLLHILKHECIPQFFGAYWPKSMSLKQSYLVIEKMSCNLKDFKQMHTFNNNNFNSNGSSSSSSLNRKLNMDILRHIGSALKFIHQNRVRHGALTPSNILLHVSSDNMMEGKAKLDINHFVTRANNNVDIYPPVKLSTFSAPEFFFWKDEGYLSSDIWSFGVLTAYLFSKTAKLFYDVSSFGMLFSQGRVDDVINKLVQISDESVKHIVSSCLVAKPNMRPTMSEVLAMMEGSTDNTKTTNSSSHSQGVSSSHLDQQQSQPLRDQQLSGRSQAPQDHTMEDSDTLINNRQPLAQHSTPSQEQQPQSQMNNIPQRQNMHLLKERNQLKRTLGKEEEQRLAEQLRRREEQEQEVQRQKDLEKREKNLKELEERKKRVEQLKGMQRQKEHDLQKEKEVQKQKEQQEQQEKDKQDALAHQQRQRGMNSQVQNEKIAQHWLKQKELQKTNLSPRANDRVAKGISQTQSQMQQREIAQENLRKMVSTSDDDIQHENVISQQSRDYYANSFELSQSQSQPQSQSLSQLPVSQFNAEQTQTQIIQGSHNFNRQPQPILRSEEPAPLTRQRFNPQELDSFFSTQPQHPLNALSSSDTPIEVPTSPNSNAIEPLPLDLSVSNDEQHQPHSNSLPLSPHSPPQQVLRSSSSQSPPVPPTTTESPLIQPIHLQNSSPVRQNFQFQPQFSKLSEKELSIPTQDNSKFRNDTTQQVPVLPYESQRHSRQLPESPRIQNVPESERVSHVLSHLRKETQQEPQQNQQQKPPIERDNEGLPRQLPSKDISPEPDASMSESLPTASNGKEAALGARHPVASRANPIFPAGHLNTSPFFPIRPSKPHPEAKYSSSYATKSPCLPSTSVSAPLNASSLTPKAGSSVSPPFSGATTTTSPPKTQTQTPTNNLPSSDDDEDEDSLRISRNRLKRGRSEIIDVESAEPPTQRFRSDQKAAPTILNEAERLNEQGEKALLGVDAAGPDCNKAFLLFKRAADKGSAKGYYNLACCYDKGRGTAINKDLALEHFHTAGMRGFGDGSYKFACHLDKSSIKKENLEAISWLQRATHQGNVEAMQLLAKKYQDGIGLRQNISEAVRFYEMASNKGDVESKYQLAKIYQEWAKGERPDLAPRALELYAVASQNKCLRSGFELAKIYKHGELGTEKDDQKFIFYLKVATSSDNAPGESFYELAQCFERGRGVPKNMKSARHYYNQAAKMEVSAAMVRLACLQYDENISSDKDYTDWTSSVELLERASKLGNSSALFHLGKTYEKIAENKKGSESLKTYKLAVKYYKQAIDKGHFEGCAIVGQLHENGKLAGERELHKAVPYYDKGARAGDARAEALLGECYLLGQGKPQNKEKALKLFHQAIEKGDAHAIFNLGDCYKMGVITDTNDPMKMAAKYFEKAANLDCIVAKAKYGECLLNGNGVAKDEVNGMKYVDQAIKGQNVEAIIVKANFLKENSKGELNKTKQALDLYMKGAKSSDITCMFAVAEIYDHGDAGPVDKKKALYWYRKCADRNDVTSLNNLGLMYEKGLGVKRNYSKAVDYYEKARKLGGIESTTNLGDCYKNGNGVKKDARKAVQLYQEAIRYYNCLSDDDPSITDGGAHSALGSCYFDGKGTKKDENRGIILFKRSLAFNDVDGLRRLGKLYIEGRLIPLDVKKGLEMLQKAVEGSDDDAAYDLGTVYYFGGSGIKRDFQKAYHYFKKAEKNNDKARLAIGSMIADGLVQA